MSSPAQIAANHANAQKSTGPKTEAGKQKARIVARRHGLTGHFYAMSDEDLAAFNQHASALAADYQPEGYREQLLVTAIAEDTWRTNRARAIENNLFALAHDKQEGNVNANTTAAHTAATHAETWLKEASNIQLLTLYESRLRRAIERNQKELESLQKERKAQKAKALEEAILLARLARMKREIYNPARDFPPGNGFEFSAHELNEIIAREARIAEAMHHQSRNWNQKRTA